jgi:signal transduction histidine kinase
VSRDAIWRRRESGTGYRLQVYLFTALIVISLVPVLLLGGWVERSAMEKEIAAVIEKHLLIASNLSRSLGRYVGDVKEGFGAAIGMALTGTTTPEMSQFLLSLGFSHVCIVDQENRLLRSLIPDSDTIKRLPPGPAVMETLHQIASKAGGAVVITDLIDDESGPRFFVLQALNDGRIAIGALGLDYIRSVQRSVVFGERGHSMIVDARGRVIAHPDPGWESTGKDASALPPVARMMNGETGVTEFYSPPMKAGMIAGYAAVPGVGWGVMVPQPISELESRANDTQIIAIVISLAGVLIAALIGWWLAKFFARPIVAIERAAGAVAAGGFDTQVEPLPKYTPRELQRLAASFNFMVTELRQREEHLKFAMREATAANRAKTEFLANMSHELRTPLNGILGFADILRHQMFGPLSERYTDYSNEIHNAGRHLLDLINDLLDMAKVESSQLSKHEVEVNLASVFESCFSMTEAPARQGRVSVVSDVPADLPYLRADKRMMTQIVLNLLSNAIKFTMPGGTVRAAARRDADGGCTVLIEDTGIGIAADQIELVIKPFYQVDSRIQRKYEGTGLGLPLVKAMAEAQGGSMSISSVVGEGTSVKVRFPPELLISRLVAA